MCVYGVKMDNLHAVARTLKCRHCHAYWGSDGMELYCFPVPPRYIHWKELLDSSFRIAPLVPFAGGGGAMVLLMRYTCAAELASISGLPPPRRGVDPIDQAIAVAVCPQP